MWKFLGKRPFFRADMAGLGKYCTGGYGRIGVYRDNICIYIYIYIHRDLWHVPARLTLDPRLWQGLMSHVRCKKTHVPCHVPCQIKQIPISHLKFNKSPCRHANFRGLCPSHVAVCKTRTTLYQDGRCSQGLGGSRLLKLTWRYGHF